MPSEAWAIIGGLVGVFLPKIFELMFASRNKQIDDATAIRQELRVEVAALRAENKTWQDKYFQLDRDWQERYYKLLAQFNEVKAEVEILRAEMDHLKNSDDKETEKAP